MRTPARGRAPSNSLPSPSAAICPLPKSGPMIPTAEDANSFTWNAWRFTVLPQCTFPTPLLLFFRLDPQGPQGWGRCGGVPAFYTPWLFASCSVWLGCSSSSVGLEGLPWLLNTGSKIHHLGPPATFNFLIVFLYFIYNLHIYMYVYRFFSRWFVSVKLVFWMFGKCFIHPCIYT